MTLGQALDLASNESLEPVAAVRNINIGDYIDISALLAQYGGTQAAEQLGERLPAINMTVGELLDKIASDPAVAARRDDNYTLSSTVGGVMNVIGEDKVEDMLQNKIAEASQVDAYENTRENILNYWLKLLLFVVAFAALSTITLEFIDKDKR